MPKVSLLIAVYNVERYLRECLDSVVNQALKDIEIICIDDGSTDGSAQILEEYAQKDNKIKLITQENQGLACSRNNALKIATGEYILCVDSDDYIRQDTLEKLYQKAKENDLDMLSFGGTNFDNETRENLGNPYYEFRYLPKDFNIDCFNYNDCTDFITKIAVSSCLTMYKYSFLKSHDIVFPPHLCFEDNVFFCKALMNAQRCGILKDTLYFRRIHSQSITQNWVKNHLDFVKVAGLVLDYLKSINVSNEIYEKYRIAYSDTVINNYNHFQNKYRKIYYKAIKSFAKKYSPDYIKKINKPDSISKYIFSVRNEDIRKVITIFGIKFKFKSKKLIERKKVANLENNVKSLIDKIDKQENNITKLETLLQNQNDCIKNLTKQINEQINNVSNDLKKRSNEILYAEVLKNCTENSNWLKKQDFTLTLGAANYSFIFILFKILDEIKPKRILEMGLGQTTKLTSQYANFYQDSFLDVIEHNQEWIDFFGQKLNLSENINIHNKNLINFLLNETKSDKYDSLEDVVQSKKYDLIIIDGPFGFDRIYPRTNVLDLIPNNLAENFIIILDDAERRGEKNTANLIFQKLDENNIKFKKSYKVGLKTQLVITSPDYEYIHWF